MAAMTEGTSNVSPRYSTIHWFLDPFDLLLRVDTLNRRRTNRICPISVHQSESTTYLGPYQLPLGPADKKHESLIGPF